MADVLLGVAIFVGLLVWTRFWELVERRRFRSPRWWTLERVRQSLAGPGDPGPWPYPGEDRGPRR